MPYGAPEDTSGLARSGYEQFRAPTLAPRFDNTGAQAGGNSEDPNDFFSYTRTNVTATALGVGNSPFGQSECFRIVDNNAGAFGSFGTPSRNVTTGRPSEHSVYLLLGSGSATSVFRFVATRSGVSPTITVTIDIQVSNGQIVAQSVTPDSEAANVTIRLKTIQVAVDVTWLRVSCTIDDTGDRGAGTLRIFPDVSDVTSVEGVTITGLMLAGCATTAGFEIPAAEFFDLPYQPYSVVNDPNQFRSEGKIPRQFLDLSYGSREFPFNALTLNFFRDQGARFVMANGDVLTIPGETVLGGEGWNSGFWALIDVSAALNVAGGNAQLVTSAAGVTVTVRGVGASGAISNVATSLVNNSAALPFIESMNCSTWLLVKPIGLGANQWQLIPLWQSHGEQRFTANGTFVWPAGVNAIFVTGSGAGGGGGGGSEDGANAGAGGGGGSGGCVVRRAIAGVPFETLTIAIGVGGAAGAAGNPAGTAGAAGTVTTITGSTSGLLLTLTGGGGGGAGVVAAAAATISGAGGGFGLGLGGITRGQSGNPGIIYAGGNAIGGDGGDNSAGGNGGASANVQAGNDGALGGGGGGGGAIVGAANAGGRGGDGFIQLEW